jgi:hypothetical protein
MANEASDKVGEVISLTATPESVKKYARVTNYMRITTIKLLVNRLGINIPEEIFEKIYEYLEPFVEVKLLMYKKMKPVITIKKCHFIYGSKTNWEIISGVCRGHQSIDPSNEIVDVFFKHGGRYVVLNTAHYLMRIIDNKLIVIAKLTEIWENYDGDAFYTGSEFMPIETICKSPIKSYEAVIKYDDIFDKWRFLHPN